MHLMILSPLFVIHVAQFAPQVFDNEEKGMRQWECVNGNASMGLKHHVNVPTHVSGHTLDLMITREHDPVISSVPVACEQQTHFRSSLLSLRKIASANPSDKTISVT